MTKRFEQVIALICVLVCMPCVKVAAEEETGGGQGAEESEEKAKRSSGGVEPDLRKVTDTTDLASYALGPTGIIGNLWRSRRPPGKLAQVGEILDGSPASGKLAVGDVIVGIGSGEFKSDVRRELAAAITEAEKKENGGKLVLNVWRKSTGKTAPVTLTLKVMGAYSATSPWNCEKTENLIKEAAEYLVNHMPGGITGNVAVLGLLATGEKKYQDAVRGHARHAAQGEAGGPWTAGYKLVMLCEYYLATGDSSVKSGIQTIAERVARGQSRLGVYGHGYATPSGDASGYGAMMQCSTICNLGMLLATKCGINSPEVNRAVNLGEAALQWYAEKGRVPYGLMMPVYEDYESNGRTSAAAVFCDIYGNKLAAESFARCSLASYNDREGGHTGQYWSWLWGALGAARGGPEAAQVFCRETRWFTELERRTTGQHHYQPTLWSDPGKYKNWDTTGARLLWYCLPRKAIYITGKVESCFPPLTGQSLKATVDAATFDPDGHSTSELLDLLGSWSWRVRRQSADALAKRGDDVSQQVIAMMASPDRLRRLGAYLAVGKCGGQGNASMVKDRLLHVLETSKDQTEQYYALTGLRIYSGKHALGKSVAAAAPDLLRLLVRMEADRTDPIAWIQQNIVCTLWGTWGRDDWRDYNGTSQFRPENFDDSVLIPALQAGLRSPQAFDSAAKWIAHLDEKQLEPLYGDIWAIATKGAFSSQSTCQKAMAMGRFKEGLELTLKEMLRKGWGGFQRLPIACATLSLYGSNVKPHLAEMKKVYDEFVANREPDEVEHMKKSWATLQENINKNVELRSIEPFLKDKPASRMAASSKPTAGIRDNVTTSAAKAPAPKVAVQAVVSPEVLATWQARFVKKLDALAKGGKKLGVNFDGNQTGIVRGANEESIQVDLQGNVLSMPWSWVSAERRAVLAKISSSDDDVESLLVAGVLNLACNRTELAENLFSKAALVDADAVNKVRAELKLLK